MTVVGINDPWWDDWGGGQSAVQYDELLPRIVRSVNQHAAQWDHAASKGRHMLMHCVTQDGWASPANFAAYVASRLNALKAHAAWCGVVELGNEPFWPAPGGPPATPETYANNCMAAINANPGVKFLVAVDDWPTAHDTSPGTVGWVQRMFAAQPGLKTAAYGWAVHPYGDDSSVTALAHLGNAIGALRSNGVPTVRIWATEWGWSTWNTSEPDQNARMGQFLSAAPPELQACFWYQNNDNNPGSARESGFGLYAINGGDWNATWRKKTSWQTYKNAINASASGDFKGTVPPPVDTTPPDTTISISHLDPASTTAQVLIFSSEAGGTFEYQLDGGPWTATPASLSLTGLSVGTHTVNARARDAAGNLDATPATAQVTVGAPMANLTLTLDPNDKRQVLITNVPAGCNHIHVYESSVDAYPAPVSRYKDISATLTSFRPDADTPWVDAAAMSSVDNSVQIGAWQLKRILTDPTFVPPPPPDTTPPTTTIVSGPAGTGTDVKAAFSLAGSEAGSTFSYSLDGAPYVMLGTGQSGFTITVTVGAHSLIARAIDPAGNVGLPSGAYAWTVSAPPPPPASLAYDVPAPTINVAADSVSGTVSLPVPARILTGAAVHIEVRRDAATNVVTLLVDGVVKGTLP